MTAFLIGQARSLPNFTARTLMCAIVGISGQSACSCYVSLIFWLLEYIVDYHLRSLIYAVHLVLYALFSSSAVKKVHNV